MKLLILIGFAFLSITTFSQDKSKLLDSVFTSLHQQKKFNGNVLIAEKGKPVFVKSYGLADVKAERLLDKQSVFELASVSKQFTAVAVVILQNQGKLNYDDKVSKYIPELNFYGNVTIRNLLNHTSGLPDYMDLFEEKWDKSKFATNEDIVVMLSNFKPGVLFQPNEKFEYSNTGYALLALIIERVSKESFASFLAKNIFKPLGMQKTFIYRSRYSPMKIENYALGYIENESGELIQPDSLGKAYFSYYLDGIVGDGMVNSTVEDLLKWDRALYTDKIINAEDKELVFQGAKLANGKVTNYGFGWMLGESKKYGKFVNHSGGWAGYITFIERNLSKDETFIILQNISTVNTEVPINDIRKIMNNEKLEAEQLTKASITSEELDKFLGIYSNENIPLKITITKKENVLYAQATEQPEFPLDSYENSIFKFDQANIQMQFHPETKEMLFKQGSMELVFNRE